MDQVITFDKSLQQRLQEYKDVLAGYEVLSVSTIEKEWGFYLELTLDPNGWQAVWKIQRKTCEALDIPFPSIVLVFVLNVDLKNLTALVRILAVQDDIHIPEKHCVPLIQLWPTKEQDKSIALNLHSSANVLDMLRFFYNNLFMPWDNEDDDTIDWKSKHLEPRLRLFYDMKNGVIPRVTAEHLHSLFTEAKRLQIKREAIESQLEVEDIDVESVNLNNPKFQALMELHIRMMEIKNEVDILENPLLRSAIIRRNKHSLQNNEENVQNIWLIYDQGSASESIDFLTRVKAHYPTEMLRFSPHLYTTLECANPNDVFVLSEAEHSIKSTGALEHGGTLKGISTREKTILTSTIEDVMLDFKGESIVLDSLTIKAVSAQCGLIIRRGKVTLNNCVLHGDGKSSTHQGIIVLAGAALEIRNCDLSQFCTAIVGNSRSSIAIQNSVIHDCNFGLKLFDNCTVNAAKTTIRNCKDYGICVETEKNMDREEPKIGAFESLNIIPLMQMEFVSGDNNAKGDAIINQKSQLKPVEDLFENPDLDPTICMDSDEELDCGYNNTVIENVEERMSPATV